MTVGRGGKLHLIEVKWSKTITPDLAAPLRRLASAVRKRQVEATLVHRASRTAMGPTAVAPGVRALGNLCTNRSNEG